MAQKRFFSQLDLQDFIKVDGGAESAKAVREALERIGFQTIHAVYK